MRSEWGACYYRLLMVTLLHSKSIHSLYIFFIYFFSLLLRQLSTERKVRESGEHNVVNVSKVKWMFVYFGSERSLLGRFILCISFLCTHPSLREAVEDGENRLIKGS